MHKITIPVNPIPKGRPRTKLYKFGVYTPKRTVDNQKAIRKHLTKILTLNEALELDWPLSGPLIVTINFYLKRPKNLCRKKDPRGPIIHTKKPDLDNLVKQILDAAEGFLWEDDKTIWSLTCKKYYHGIDEQPRIEIEIE